MKLNQRKNNNEQEKQQRELRSTVLEKYKNHVEHIIQDSEISFDSIETPGWTSLVNTEQSKFTNFHHNKKQSNPDTHIQILNRLNSLPKLNTKSDSYSNIRLNAYSKKNKNLIVYGSVKLSQKNQNQTPKSRQSQKGSLTSRRSQKNLQKDFASLKKNQNVNNGASNKFLNRFNNKPNIFYSVEKPTDKNFKTTHKRTQSVRSQPSQNLKEKIHQRLSMGNNRPSPRDSECQRNIFTEPNQQTISQRYYEQKNNFYSLKTQPKVSKDNKNQYFNRYMTKLSLRNKNQGSVKIFKKSNFNQPFNNQSKNTTKMDLIKDKQNTAKRFNTITVHDYLYQDHIKLESKKKMQKMIEDSYNKATYFTFTPFISEKSNLLADSKFQRESIGGKKQENQKHRLESCFKKTQKKLGKPLKQSIYKVQEQISMKQKQKMSEMIQNRTLLRLFSFLSDDTQQINDKTIEVNIQKLPLSLIQLIEPFLTKVYQKHKFSLRQFMEMFSAQQKESKQKTNLSSHKLVIISQTQKFFRNMGLKKEKDSLISIKESELNFIR